MVKIIADTTSCLDPSYVAEHDVPVLPQIINFGDESYLECLEIDYDTFLHKLQTSPEPPKTAAPPPELFVEVFTRLAEEGEEMVCILPSAKVSGTVRSAVVALQTVLEQVPSCPDVHIVDTELIASPVAMLVRLAVQWADDGVAAAEIAARVREMSRRGKIYFVVDTLKYLARGGRIGRAAALVGSVLSVKPVLTFVDGEVDSLEKVRTHRRAVARLKQLVLEQISPTQGYLSVLHAAAEEEAEELADFFAEALNLSQVPVYAVPPAIVTHGGPGVLGVGFFTE